VNGAAADAPLWRQSGVPLYLQITRRLRRELAESSDDSDRPLFTEEGLAQRFGVHRMTIRQALRELEQDGLSVRLRGVGTFRAPHKLRGEPIYLDSFLDHWAMQGRRVGGELLSVQEEFAEGRVAHALGLFDDVRIVHVVRLRRVDDQPLVLDHIFLPAATGHALNPADLLGLTLHRAIRLRTGRIAAAAELEIEATVAQNEGASLLGLVPGSPLFRRHIILVDALHQPLSYGWSLYRADLYKYTLTVPLDPERAYSSDEVVRG
jgi:GntR family transcriptional regulator